VSKIAPWMTKISCGKCKRVVARYDAGAGDFLVTNAAITVAVDAGRVHFKCHKKCGASWWVRVPLLARAIAANTESDAERAAKDLPPNSRGVVLGVDC